LQSVRNHHINLTEEDDMERLSEKIMRYAERLPEGTPVMPKRLLHLGGRAAVDQALVQLLVTIFRDLRSGRTEEGWQVQQPGTVMSTAEAVAITAAIHREGVFFPSGFDPVSRLPGHLLGAVMKDDAKDRERLLGYWDGAVRRRADTGAALWKRLADLRGILEG
jgi:hypothetical protein